MSVAFPPLDNEHPKACKWRTTSRGREGGECLLAVMAGRRDIEPRSRSREAPRDTGGVADLQRLQIAGAEEQWTGECASGAQRIGNLSMALSTRRSSNTTAIQPEAAMVARMTDVPGCMVVTQRTARATPASRTASSPP